MPALGTWMVNQLINYQSLGSSCQPNLAGFCFSFQWLNDVHNNFSFGVGDGPAAAKTFYVKSLICSVTPACHEGGTAVPREGDKHLKRGMKEASNISAACKIAFCFQLLF